jgi:hypothetical protein
MFRVEESDLRHPHFLASGKDHQAGLGPDAAGDRAFFWAILETLDGLLIPAWPQCHPGTASASLPFPAFTG